MIAALQTLDGIDAWEKQGVDVGPLRAAWSQVAGEAGINEERLREWTRSLPCRSDNHSVCSGAFGCDCPCHGSVEGETREL